MPISEQQASQVAKLQNIYGYQCVTLPQPQPVVPSPAEVCSVKRFCPQPPYMGQIVAMNWCEDAILLFVIFLLEIV